MLLRLVITILENPVERERVMKHEALSMEHGAWSVKRALIGVREIGGGGT